MASQLAEDILPVGADGGGTDDKLLGDRPGACARGQQAKHLHIAAGQDSPIGPGRRPVVCSRQRCGPPDQLPDQALQVFLPAHVREDVDQGKAVPLIGWTTIVVALSQRGPLLASTKRSIVGISSLRRAARIPQQSWRQTGRPSSSRAG